MKGQFFFLHFDDEAPALGSGRRVVYVHSVGTKHVKVRAVGNLCPAKIPARLWGRLAKSAQPVNITKAQIKNAISLKRRAGVKITKSMKELVQ